MKTTSIALFILSMFYASSLISQTWGGSTTTSGNTSRSGTVSIIGNTSALTPLLPSNDFQLLLFSDHKKYVFKAYSNISGQHAITTETTDANTIAYSVKYNPSSISFGGTTFTPSNDESFVVLGDGRVFATELTIKKFPVFPDYVFNPNYNLLSLYAIEKHIKQYNRLPGIPSATEVAENGLSLGTMQVLQMEKIEELTLHAIELKKENDKLKAENEKLRADVDRILKELNMD